MRFGIERAAIDETFEASFLRQYHDGLPPAAGEPYESGMSVARRLARVLVDELGFRLELDTDALSPHEQPRLWTELRYRRGGDVVCITNSDIRIATEWSLRLNGVRLEGDWEDFEAGLRGAAVLHRRQVRLSGRSRRDVKRRDPGRGVGAQPRSRRNAPARRLVIDSGDRSASSIVHSLSDRGRNPGRMFTPFCRGTPLRAPARCSGHREPDMRSPLLIVLVLCGWTELLGAQQRPAEPFVIRDVCPYECCRLGAWTSRGTVAVRAAPRSDASVAFTLGAGDSVTALRGDLWTSTLGRAVVRRPPGPKFRDSTLRPAVGDTVYVVALSGEAGWYVWHDGVLHEDVDSFWSDRTPLHAGASAALLSPPEGLWWVEIRRGEGARGWVPVSRISPYGLFGIEPGFDGTSACS